MMASPVAVHHLVFFIELFSNFHLVITDINFSQIRAPSNASIHRAASQLSVVAVWSQSTTPGPIPFQSRTRFTPASCTIFSHLFFSPSLPKDCTCPISKSSRIVALANSGAATNKRGTGFRLSSKRLHAATEPFLYSRIRLEWTITHILPISKLLRTLLERSLLAGHIRSIHLSAQRQ